LFKLFIRNIFIVCIFDELHELSCGFLSDVDGINILHGMSRWVILRYRWPLSCDRQMRRWAFCGCGLHFLQGMRAWSVSS
jgi:hypothetical protein